MNEEIILSRITGLSNDNILFSPEANAHIGNSYTSEAGNSYFNSLRFGEGILIKEDVGIGYLYTFLNGVRIYSLRDNKLIADETFHRVVYSQDKVKRVVKRMLMHKLEEASKMQGFSYNIAEADHLVNSVIEKAFIKDQIEMMRLQLNKFKSLMA